MAIGNAKSRRDLSLLMVVRLMRWQTGFMLGLLEWSREVNIGRRVALLGSSISKTLQHLMGSLILTAENWLLKMEKLLRALDCTDAQKVVYVTFALQDSAERWWTSTEQFVEDGVGREHSYYLGEV